MKHILLIALFGISGVFCAFGQVKVYQPGASTDPHPSAGLEVDFNNRGVLPPRLSTLERSAISSPSPGLFVYNTDINCIEFFNGSFWQVLCGLQAECSAPPLPPELNAASDFSITQFRVNWNSSSGATSYLVQASLQSDFSNLIVNQPEGNVTFADIQDLSTGDVCFYRVAAVNSCGTSPFSAIQSAVIPDGQVQGLATTQPFTITGTSAWSGGSYSSDGGVTPSDRGICWSTNSPPTTADFVASIGGGIGGFSLSMSSLTPLTTYYVRAYVTNAAGTFFGNEQTFTTLDWVPEIGEFHEGGHVFYVDDNGGYGLLISPANQADYDAAWGCPGQFIEGASDEGVGGGATNTASISSQCGEDNVAARICSELTESGFSDWFLPSKDEFQLAWDNVTPLGLGVEPDTYQYWTSTQFNEWEAWFFGSGGLGWYYGWKGDGGRNVRCIRAFCTASPAIPNILAPSDFSTNQFRVNWENVTGAYTYLLQASLQSDFETLIFDQNVGNANFGDIQDLSIGDVCYYRVAAVNSCGTSPYSFSQSATIPDGVVAGVVTDVPSQIGSIQATSGGSYAFDGGIIPSDRGVCWSTDPSPTIDHYSASSGGGSGSFIAYMTGLDPLTAYYVRAYVSNPAGIFYGDEVSFTTNSVTISFNDAGLTTWVVPPSVEAVVVKAWGAGGGGGGGDSNKGGGGGFASSIIPVTAGETLSIIVGGGGGNGVNDSSGGNLGGGQGGSGGDSGFGSGGNGSNSGALPHSAGGGGGGGGTFVLRDNIILLAAGGGGGGGGAESGSAGAGGGGGENGGAGSCGAQGGVAGSNAVPAGEPGVWPGNIDASGAGGGGGGYFGGGGGGAPSCDAFGGGGGGGGANLGTVTVNGSGTIPGNSGDPERENAGGGGNIEAPGVEGRLIISW